jgi:competence protein ComEA
MKIVLYVLIGIFTGFILAAILFIVIRLPGGQPVALEPSPTKAPIVIQVIGEVTRPGVYTLQDGSRVEDAVNSAGGLLADADSNSVNLAARLEDGQQIKIPAQAGSGASSTISGSSPAPFSVVATLTPTAIAQATLININIATIQQLDTLPGIGPVTAQSIVTYRQQHGPFQHIEDIMNVPGIGPATFDHIKDLITVGS